MSNGLGGGGGSPGDYSPGGPSQSPSQSPSYPSQILGSMCGENELCDCLGDTLAGIEYALQDIARILDERLGRVCDHIDECIDEIIKAIDDKYRGVHYTCEQCQSMIEQGLAGTLEFALTCAACTESDCNAQCSLGDPSTEGKCCKGCGQDPCCCVEGVCSPCGEEQPKKKKYQGWCNRETGLVTVQDENEPSPGGGYVPVSLSENEQEALDAATAYCAGYQQAPQPPPQLPIPPIGSPTPLCDLSQFVGNTALEFLAATSAGSNAIGAGATIANVINAFGFEGINVGNAIDFGKAAMQLWLGGDWLRSQQYMPQIANLIGCGDPAFAEAGKILAAVGLASKTSGFNFEPFTKSYQYAMHAACRQVQMSPDQATAAYLANAIDGNALDTLWGIAGFCPDAVKATLYASRAKPVPLQLAMMRRREIINQADYHSGMRQLGYLETPVAENLFKLTEQIPTYTDLTRLMVRDAADESIEFWPESDALFGKKYTGSVKKWAEYQAIPEEFFKLYWRAHWTIPAPTQLFEFWRRLRNNPDFNGDGKLWDRISGALTQQDILPFWHKYYQAVAYHPLGRIDIRRAFNIGAMSDDEALEAYKQIGYSDENAARLLKFAKLLRRDAAAANKAVKLWQKFAISRDEAYQRMTDDGLPAEIVNRALDDAAIGFLSSPYSTAFLKGDISRDALFGGLADIGVPNDKIETIVQLLSVKRVGHPALEDYAVGSDTRENVEQAMVNDGVHPDVATALLNKIDHKLSNARVAQCQKGVKRRYLLGEFDADQAQNALESYGTVSARASDMIEWWKCELSSTGKQVAASKLCDWLARGAIDSTDFLKRLRTIGYSETDAALMLDDCLISINTKRLAEAKKEAKEQAALDQKRQRALNRAAAAEAREAQQIFRAQQAAATARKNREKQLLSAASKVANMCECDLYDSRQYVREQRDGIMQGYGLNQDEALQAILSAIDEWQGGTTDTLTPIIDGFASDAAGVTGEPAL